MDYNFSKGNEMVIKSAKDFVEIFQDIEEAN